MVHEDDDGVNQIMTYFKSDVFVQDPARRDKVIEMAWFYLITLLFWKLHTWALHLNHSHFSLSPLQSPLCLSPKFMIFSLSVIVRHICIYIHMCIHNVLSRLNFTCMGMHLGLTVWEWTIYAGICPGGNWFFLFLWVLTTCNSSSRNGTVENFHRPQWHVN